MAGRDALARNSARKAVAAATSALIEPRGNRIIGLGDSITGLAYDRASQSCTHASWLHQACVNSGGVLQFVFNAGVPGERTDQFLTRIQVDVIDRKPTICTVMGGTNDVAQGVPTATTAENLEKIVNLLLKARIRPVVCTIPPRSDGFETEVAKVNLVVWNLAGKYGLDVLDFHSLLVDPATGKYKAGYSTDNIHPTVAAIKIMGQYVVDKFVPRLPMYIPGLPVYNGNSQNLVTNGLFIGDANSDGLADNWSSYGSGIATFSLVTDSAIQGNWQRLSKTDTASTKTISKTISTGFSAGDRFAFLGRIKTSGIETNEMPVTVQIAFTGASGMMRPLSNWKTDNSGVFFMESTVPQGTTALTMTITAGVGTGIVDIAQVAVYNLSKIGV